MSNSSDYLSEKMLQDAINQLKRQSQQQQMANSYIDPRALNGFGPQYNSMGGFGNMVRKRLRLEHEGHEVILQTDVPQGMPMDYVARQFADQVYRLLRDFPHNWSSTGSSNRADNSQDNAEPEPEPDGDRFGNAFE